MLSCPLCRKAHFPMEVCGSDSEPGIAWNEKLRRLGHGTAGPVEPAAAPPTLRKPRRPLAERAERFDRVAYQRNYMRAWRKSRKER